MNGAKEEKKYRPNAGSIGGYLAPGLVSTAAGLGTLGAMSSFKPQPPLNGDEGVLGALAHGAKKHGAEIRKSENPLMPAAAWRDLDTNSFLGKLSHDQIENMTKGGGAVKPTGIAMHPGVRSGMKAGVFAHELGHIKQPKILHQPIYHSVGKMAPSLGAMYVASTHDQDKAKKAAIASSLMAAPMMASEVDASIRGARELSKATLKATGKGASLLRRASPFGGIASYASVAAAPWIAYGTKKALGGYRPKQEKKPVALSAREELNSIINLNSITYHETEAERFTRKARGHREKSDASLGLLGYATTGATAATLSPGIRNAAESKIRSVAHGSITANSGKTLDKFARFARDNAGGLFKAAAWAPAAALGAGYALHKVGAWRNDSKANKEYGQANDLRKARNSQMQSLLAGRMRQPVAMSARDQLNTILFKSIARDDLQMPDAWIWNQEGGKFGPANHGQVRAAMADPDNYAGPQIIRKVSYGGPRMRVNLKNGKKTVRDRSGAERELSAREELDTILLGAGYGKLKQTLHSDGNGNITGAEFDVENEKGILAHMKRNAGKYASLPLGVAMAGVSGNAGVGLVPVLGGTVVDGFRKQRQIKKRLKEEGYMLSVRDQLDTILFGPGDWRDKASDNAGAVAAASGAVGGLSSYVRGGVENSANWTNKRRVMGSLAGGAVAGLGGYAIAKLLKKDKPGQAQVAGRIGSGHQNSLSARDELNLIALGVDANGKLHNSKGEFGGDNDAVAHPEAMRMAYQRAAGLGATAGAAGVAGGMGMKALIEKLKGLKRK